ncbi:MAG: dienelactone hydrolase family protein [Deltaproteobacteria bacterium]|nr:dienelactone hydrolase family protein [Deltaproteobacteria bacterium]
MRQQSGARIRRNVWTVAFAALWLAGACGSGETSKPAADTAATTDAGSDTQTSIDWSTDGPHPVGHVDFVLHDAKRNRDLRVTAWYPAAESSRTAAEKGVLLADFYPVDSPEHATLTALLAKAPKCVRPQTRSAASAEPAGTGWPLVAFSHCHTCLRFENTTVNERLASHGIAVVAPDHTGNTLFDFLAGKSATLGVPFLQTREDDIRFVVDQVLDPSNTAIPQVIRGKFDPARVAALGHSFGGVTIGKAIQDDPRFKAGFAMAVPMAQPILPGVKMADIHVPVGFLLAQEDNSILLIGNNFLLKNFADANPPAWLVQVADAGHFSFADIAGIIPNFDAGCGDGKRMADQSPFTYLDNGVARQVAARVVGAFFGQTLLGDAKANAQIVAAEPPGVVTATQK